MLCGTIIYGFIFAKKNKIMTLGGGMIIGPLSFLLILEIASYIVKGVFWIKILFLFYILFVGVLGYKKREKIAFLFAKSHISFTSMFPILVIAFYVVSIFLYGRSAITGGDSSTYWGIASSFAHGNYPTVLPWQPEFLTVYHEGAFIFLGSLLALTSINIAALHFYFSFYIIAGLFLFVTGLAKEKNNNFFVFLPAVLGIIVYIAPVLPISNIFTFFSTCFNPASLPLLASLPQAGDIKAAAGAGVQSLGGLFYSNFYSFGLSVFFLFISAFMTEIKKPFYKITLLTILLFLLLSIDETFFLIALALLIGWFVRLVFQTGIKYTIKPIIYFIILFLCLFFVLQNPIRDSLLTPSMLLPRFAFLDRNSALFAERISYMQSSSITDQILHITWYLPSIIVLISILIIFSLTIRSGLAFILSCAAVIALFCGSIIVNTFWPANGLRFINTAYNLATFAIGFLLLEFFKHKQKFFRFVGILFLIFLLPSLIASHIKLFATLLKDDGNYIRTLGYTNPSLDWIIEHVPSTKRILFVDDFPTSYLYSSNTADALEYYGIFVPTADPGTKVLNVDNEGYWFDAITTLSPHSLKTLKIDYLFVKNPVPIRFDNYIKEKLTNSAYFEPIHNSSEGNLYKVHESYFSLPEHITTLHAIVNAIPERSSVYLGTFTIPEVRKAFLLSLSTSTKLYGKVYSIGYDYPMYIERKFPIIQAAGSAFNSVDYAILPLDTRPSNFIKGNYDKMLQTSYAVLWKRID